MMVEHRITSPEHAESAGQRSPARRAKRPRGQSLVELAITIPVLLMILLGTVDLGRMFFGYIELRNGAFEGARYGATMPSDTSGIEDLVLAHGVPSGTSVTVTCSNGDCTAINTGDNVTITVSDSATFQPIFTQFIQAKFGIGSFTMSASATVKVAT